MAAVNLCTSLYTINKQAICFYVRSALFTSESLRGYTITKEFSLADEYSHNENSPNSTVVQCVHYMYLHIDDKKAFQLNTKPTIVATCQAFYTVQHESAVIVVYVMCAYVEIVICTLYLHVSMSPLSNVQHTYST